MDNMPLMIAMRWLHLVCIALLVGGLAFVVLCAPLAQRWLDDEQDFAVIKQIERRFRKLLALAIVGIIISGMFNWMFSVEMYRIAGSALQIVLGIKVIAAVILIAVLWAQDVGLMIHPSARFWRVICLVLALSVMLLAGSVRYLRLDALVNLTP